MIDRFEAVRDKTVPYKQVRVSPELVNQYMPPSVKPNVPMLIEREGAQTVAQIAVDDSLMDNRIHLDPITASNLGFATDGERNTVTLQPAPFSEVDEIVVQNATSLPPNARDALGDISSHLKQLFAGRFFSVGDETVVPAEVVGVNFPVVITDYAPRNQHEGVAYVTENTRVTVNLTDPNAGGGSQLPTTPDHGQESSPSDSQQNMSSAELEETHDSHENEADHENITFESIGGLDDEIRRVREIVERPLADPEAFQGVPTPSGVLLYGPPGTGKTMLAKAVANEIDATFYAISGSEIFDKNYGESERNLRSLFEEAKLNGPSIIFIDELEALIPPREDLSGSNQVERRVVTQLKTLMDGFESGDRVVLLGATNHPDEIDDAFLRPGRFDRLVEVSVPDEDDRREIFQIHTREMNLQFDDDDYLDELVEKTAGYTGADIADLCTKANMQMQRRLTEEYSDYTGQQKVSAILKNEDEGYKPEDFEAALDEKTPSLLNKHDVDVPEVNWNDIGGHSDVKERLRQQVDGPLKAPELWDESERSSGILLYGPPGTGKTMLAKAMATESDRVFIGVQATQLKSKWVGETERNIRKIFSLAKSLEPSILYIDEMEAIARPRGANTGDAGVADAATSQLLSELDGIEDRGDVIVVGSTNAQYNPEQPLQQQNVQWGLDPAILRPGRLETHSHVPKPDEDGRREIFRIHLDKVADAGNVELGDIDVDDLAERTDGVSGADIEGICWEAKQAARQSIITDAGGFEQVEDDVTITLTHDHLRDAVEEYSESADVRAASNAMFN